MNRFKKLCALCAALFICASSFADDLANYQFPDWNDYEITFDDPDAEWVCYSGVSGGYVKSKQSISQNSSISLKAAVTVDTDAILCFDLRCSSYFTLTVLIDGVETAFYDEREVAYTNISFAGSTASFNRIMERLSSGAHSIEWRIESASTYFTVPEIYNISVVRTPAVSVNLLEPGSLGTEILHQVNSLKDVRNLKVSGRMNDDDWDKIYMMTENLMVLDLSDAVITEIPNNAFYKYPSKKTKFLHTVILPEGLRSIGSEAFSNSQLVDVRFPSTLEKIGSQAFYKTSIREVVLPDNCTELGNSAFEYCPSLRRLSLSANLKVVPPSLCSSCFNLQELDLNEGLTEIGYGAFRYCNYAHPDLPITLVTLNGEAFKATNSKGEIKAKLVIPESVRFIGRDAFGETGYTDVTLPQNCHSLSSDSYNFIPSSTQILRLNTPTVLKTQSLSIGSLDFANATLVVPEFLVTSYKLDSYWYKFGKIEGFDTEEFENWNINADLVLGAYDRMLGTPSVNIYQTGGLKINGTDGMSLSDLTVWNNYSNASNVQYGRIFSNTDNVTVNNNLVVKEYFDVNRWYYVSLPFNIKVDDIFCDNDVAKKAMRYYDGANRATNGTGDNWRNYDKNDVIPAGTGFIFQTSVAAWWSFPAQNDESKQYMTSNRMFVKELAANTSGEASNSGWNLVGNPYQAWYNIHMLNFTAPITVRNIKNNTYEAYSIIDDDYAIAPNQAFFVQCPEGMAEISFPLNGRQMTSEIKDQNGAPAKNPEVSRVLVDLVLSDGESADKTRVVLNQKASMEYETSCDASKFLSEENVAQLYTLDDEGTMYAINERPVLNGEVQLGVVIPADGKYSFSLQRNMADNVYIVDGETGEMVDITDGEFEFHAAAGVDNSRFKLVLESGEATGITTVAPAAADTSIIYNVAGQKVNDSFKGIVVKNGKKVLR